MWGPDLSWIRSYRDFGLDPMLVRQILSLYQLRWKPLDPDEIQLTRVLLGLSPCCYAHVWSDLGWCSVNWEPLADPTENFFDILKSLLTHIVSFIIVFLLCLKSRNSKKQDSLFEIFWKCIVNSFHWLKLRNKVLNIRKAPLCLIEISCRLLVLHHRGQRDKENKLTVCCYQGFSRSMTKPTTIRHWTKVTYWSSMLFNVLLQLSS